MRDQGVLGMDLEPIVRQFLICGFFVEDLDVQPFPGCGIGGGNGTVEGGPDAALLARHFICRSQVIAFKPKPCVLPQRRRRQVVADSTGIGLHGIPIRGWVKIALGTKHIAAGIVGAGDGGEHDVPLVPAPGPVDDVILPVGRQVEAADRQAFQLALAIRRERQALPMDEVQTVVKHFPRDAQHGDDAGERDFVHEHLEDRLVVVGVVLIARRGRNRKCRKAFPASVAFGPAPVLPVGLVSMFGSKRRPMIPAKRVGARGHWRWFEVTGNSGKFLGETGVALKGRHLAARFAFQQRKALPTAR